MAQKIIMPKQGLQMTEGIITAWLKQEGDFVTEGEPLFEMETDKLAITIASTATGTLLKILHPAEDVVPITETIAVVGEPGEDIRDLLGTCPGGGEAAPQAAAAADSAEPAYDVAVLGGGPGGYECAIRCAQYGLKTALIEARELGGTCLNRGCIPTKALLQSAHTYQTVLAGKTYGIMADGATFDYAAVAQFKNSVVKKLRSGVESLERAYGVQVFCGFGKLVDSHTIAIGAQQLTAKHIVLATGSAPAKLPIPGIDGPDILTSDDVLELTELPDSVVMIGGGVIGVEFATLFAAFGKQVTIIEMMPRILPGLDEELSHMVAQHLKKQGVRMITGAKVLSFSDQKPVEVQYEIDGRREQVRAARCVVSIGRKPQTADLGLEQVGVATERGFVVVKENMETSVPGIYAIGAITGKIQLAHVATAQGMAAAAHCAGKSAPVSYHVVPACIYTEPEVAYVGLTEEQARQSGRKIRVGRFNVGTNGKAMIMGSHGMIKLIVDETTGEILGGHIYGPRATDLIGEIAAVMRCEGTVEELSATIHPHPSVSEIILEAAHDTEGLSCNAMPKKA